VHVPQLNTSASGWTNLHAAVEWLGKKGVRYHPGGIRKGAGATTCASFIRRATKKRPSAARALSSELVQAPPEVIAALG